MYIYISTQIIIIIMNNNGGFSWIFLASTQPPGFLARASKNCEAQSKEGNKEGNVMCPNFFDLLRDPKKTSLDGFQLPI